MKEFERDYAAFEKIKASYHESLSEEEKEKVRADYKAWADGIEAKGKDYADTFRIYKDARDNGNSRMDISEPHEHRDIPQLIANLKEYGVTEFTFSSGWSSAIEASWEFLQNGCELAGMVEVFTGHTAFMSDEKETAPAYLFRIA
jgi:hypothetical protein